MTPKGWYDITVPLKQGMSYFPTDPVPPKIYRYHDVELGARVTMSMIEMISHTGTHIDTPLHFIPGGSTVSDMPLDATIGPARVIEIKDPEKIKVPELEKHNIKKGERILCKTRNSPTTYESPEFVEDYVYLDGSAADYLVGHVPIELPMTHKTLCQQLGGLRHCSIRSNGVGKLAGIESFFSFLYIRNRQRIGCNARIFTTFCQRGTVLGPCKKFSIDIFHGKHRCTAGIHRP